MVKNNLKLLFAGLIVIMLAFLFFVFQILSKRKIGNATKKNLPNISLLSLKGEEILLHKVINRNKYTVIVLFESRCGSCRTFLSELVNTNLDTDGGRILLLTHENMNSIDKQFIERLLEANNSQFYFVDPGVFLANFGSIKVPQLLVYDQDLIFSEKLSKVLFFKEKFYREK